MPRPSKGFTLIELMIYIIIVAVLATIGLANYSRSQILGRDFKRKEDLRTIKIALDVYFLQNKQYPGSTWVWKNSTAGDNWFPELLAGYLTTLPVDPTNNAAVDPAANAPNYSLAYSTYDPGTIGNCGGGTNSYYFLIARLENKTDLDRIEVKDPKVCGSSTGVYSGFNWAGDLYVLMP